MSEESSEFDAQLRREQREHKNIRQDTNKDKICISCKHTEFWHSDVGCIKQISETPLEGSKCVMVVEVCNCKEFKEKIVNEQKAKIENEQKVKIEKGKKHKDYWFWKYLQKLKMNKK